MVASRTLRRPGEPDLAWQVHLPEREPSRSVLVQHGFDEHSGRYAEVVAHWLERGMAVATYDLRGHGRSAGTRGHVDAFEDYLRDAKDLLAELAGDPAWRAGGAPVLFGHSMGGLIALALALDASIAPGTFRALALTSPYLELALPVPALKVTLGKLMSRLLPRFAERTGLAGSLLTHDAAVAQRYDADPLRFRRATARWYTEVVAAQARVFERAPALRLPVLCLAAGDDRVVSTAATERLFARLGSVDKELAVLPGLYHEVLNEPDRATHIARLADWMARH